MTTRQLALKAAHLALELKAQDIVLLNLKKLTTIADYFVICSGDSDVQVKAVADKVKEGLKEVGANTWHDEGYKNRMWILLDYVDFVVHVFHRDSRQFYNLEKLWGDAKIEKIRDEKSPVSPAVKKQKQIKISVTTHT